jgi:hypothetical protein
MKKILGIILLAVFVLSFGAGILLTANSAEAGCLKSCSIIRCIPEMRCVCGGNPYCCKCVRWDF